jgi:NodT family efflux transporter outer membrane factor (OMF) lipoprotein
MRILSKSAASCAAPTRGTMRAPRPLRASIRRTRRLIAAAAGAGLLLGCTVGPDFMRPEHTDDRSYETPGAAPQAAGGEPAQRFALGKRISGQWWQLYRSSPLDEVLGRALAGNRTLAAAKATLAQAAELAVQVQGARYPQIGLNAGAQRSKVNFTPSGVLESGPTANLFTLGPTVKFDLDLFGGLARDAERQGAVAEFQAHQLNAAYLTLTGDAVARAIEVASVRAQIEEVNEIIAQDQRKLEAVRKLLRIEDATRIDVLSAESQLATDRTLLPPLYQQLSVARHALSLLAGEAPADWSPPEFELADFTLPDEIPLSLPSELVRQRPDILAAEAQLHAASASIGVAEAQFYPNITLSGSLTQQALSPSTLFVPEATVWSLASNLAAPIFNGGRLTAQKRAAEDAFHASYASYEQTVLAAFTQVADLMDALEHDRQAVEAQRRAVEATAGSAKATRESFLSGEAKLLQVLDAERLYGQARLGLIRAITQRLVDTSRFLVAMGGAWWDWQAEEADAEAAAPP